MSFKINLCCGNLPYCSGVKAGPSGPKSHTFTVILGVFASPPPSQDGVINGEKVYCLEWIARAVRTDTKSLKKPFTIWCNTKFAGFVFAARNALRLAMGLFNCIHKI